MAEGASVDETYLRLYKDTAFADVSFIVNGKTITAHTPVIVARCPALLKKEVKKVGKKKNITSAEVNSAAINEQTLNSVLQYVYTGKIDFSRMKLSDVLVLSIGATIYNLERLNWMCESFIRKSLDMDNMFEILKNSNDLNCPSVKKIALAFALNNYMEFIGKGNAEYLGLALFQEVVTLNASPREEDIEPKEPRETLIDNFKKLYESMEASDHVFRVGGTNIPCHKALIGPWSPNLASSLQRKEDLPISPEAFKSVLRYMYFGDEDVEALAATELVPFCQSNQVHGLQKICEEKIKASIEQETVLKILGVAYLPQLQDREDLISELKTNCIKFIVENLTTDLDLGPLRNMRPQIAVDVLHACQKAESG